jgi:hypothetical protein
MALLLASACARNGGTTGAEPPPRAGARVLAISTNPRPIPPPTSSDFLAAFDLAAAAGARGGFLSYTWSSLEADAGKLDVRRVRDDIAFAQSRGLRILLGVQVINTTAKETPADLQNVPFDDARMRARFHTLIDSIASVLPNVTYLSIGNEVGTYLSSTSGWDAYRAFYTEGAGYIRAKAPTVLVGVTNEYLRAAGPDRSQAAALNAASDIAVFTYYPLGSNFHVTGPTATRSAFPDMLALANGKPVIVQELGYPSASLLGSSEQQQADFFTDAIAQWAAQRSEQMPFLNVFLLHDFTQAQCDAFGVYYALPNSAEFKAFLCSLGLRSVDGTPKAAWAALEAAARAAGLP